MPARGFSLVELLVSLGVIALLSAVAAPNLINFSKNQEIEATAAQVANILKIAQSNAFSRIKCPNGQNSDAWIVRFASGNYSLMANCQPTLGLSVLNYTYSPDGKGRESLFSARADRCPSIDIIFSGNQITYLCPGSAAQTGDVKVTLYKGTSLLKTVKIETGGVIKVE